MLKQKKIKIKNNILIIIYNIKQNTDAAVA